MKNNKMKARLIGFPALMILTASLTMFGLNAAPATSGSVTKSTLKSDYKITPFNPTMQSGSCAAACTRWVTCVSGATKMTPAQKRQGVAQCMRQCRRNKQKVLACYKKTKNSCPSYFKCMVKLAR